MGWNAGATPRELALTASALTLPMLLAQLVPEGLWIVGAVLVLAYWGTIAAYGFLVVDHVAHGRQGLPYPDDLDGHNLVRAFLRAGAVAFVASLPTVVALKLSGTAPGAGGLPLGLVALGALLGALIVPASGLAIYVSGSAVGAVWPPAWWTIVQVDPAAYGRTAASAVAVAAVWSLLTEASLRVGLPAALAGVIVAWVTALGVISLGGVLGTFVREHPDDFGL